MSLSFILLFCWNIIPTWGILILHILKHIRLHTDWIGAVKIQVISLEFEIYVPIMAVIQYILIDGACNRVLNFKWNRLLWVAWRPHPQNRARINNALGLLGITWFSVEKGIGRSYRKSTQSLPNIMVESWGNGIAMCKKIKQDPLVHLSSVVYISYRYRILYMNGTLTSVTEWIRPINRSQGEVLIPDETVCRDKNFEDIIKVKCARYMYHIITRYHKHVLMKI